MFGRKRFLVIAFIAFTVAGAGAQEIDASGARIRLAVPDVLVLDNLVIDGNPWIAYLSADEDGQWSITYLKPQVESVIPAAVVLDLARLSFSPDGNLTIDDIYLDGEFYSGTIDFSDDLWTVEGFSFDPADPPTAASNRRLAELAAILAVDDAESEDQPVALEEPLDRVAPDDQDTDSTDPNLTEPAPEAVPATAADLSPVDTERYDQAIADIGARLARVEQAVTNLADGGAQRATQIQRAIEAIADEVENATGEASAMSVRLTAIEEATQTLLERSARIEELARTLGEGVPATANRTEPGPGSSERERVVLEPAESRPPQTAVALSEGEPVEAFAPTLSLEWARARFGAPTAVDLSSTTVLRGTWDRSTTMARQNDPDELFAKLDLPFVQDGRPRLYRMITRSLDPEWAGVGLHLTVNDVELPRGYGHGRSLLVWLTRDPASYGNEDTYLEVYRSFDDVHMDRIAQAHIETSLVNQHALEILIDPGAGYITLAVNGVEYLRYRLDKPIEGGFSLAIRSLGRAEFRELEYRSIRD